jgi:hypothetical protein
LDATPLPAELGDFQWIDFRGTVGANHSAVDSGAQELEPHASASPPMAVSRRRLAWYVPVGVAAAAAVVLVFSAILPREAPPPIDLPPDPGPVVLPALAPFPWIWILLLVLVSALGAFLFWLRHRRTRGKRLERAPPTEIERLIAVELEAAIIRRAAPVDSEA